MQITEICVQVYSSFQIIREKLRLNGFKENQVYNQYDNYYTHIEKSQLKTVSYANLVQNTVLLRTRKASNLEEKLLIYKNKTINESNEVIKEELVESRVVDMPETKRIFTLMGLNNWCRLVINEYEFVKNNISIIIQDVQGLGLFLEIQEIKDMPGSSESKFRELIYVANSLGLDLGKDFSCKKNYMLFKKQNNF